MVKNNFRFSDSSIQQLVQLTDGMLSTETFETVASQLESEAANYYFNATSEANLLRIFNSIYDRIFFFRELSKYPHHAEIIVAISASSNYLTDIVVRHPENLYQLFDHDFLTTQLSYELLLQEVTAGIKRFNAFASRLNYLRQFKQRYILKIGTNDILHFNELIDTTRQLSFLAKAINSVLFETCYEEVLKKYAVTRPRQKYCLCSLGKLGGGELNYSSDVDLLLFYDVNENLTSIKKDYHEILAETVQLFSKSSTDITPNGYIYRIDFRLRPDGKYSPLCKALNDYIKYYEMRGEDWERQMLIKLDYVGGDQSLFKEFDSFVTPFIYRMYHSSSIKDKIRMMKQNIERQHESKNDVKIFKGGIRDIEFAIQSLQLLNGGKYPELRTGNSLIALEKLLKRKLISKNERDTLTAAYIFYRRIEHFLQLMNDTQTHRIPEDNKLINKLAVYLQLDSASQFAVILEKYRNQVRTIYDVILKADSKTYESISEGIQFLDKNKAEKNLQFLRNGQGIIERKEFDSRTIQLFNTLEPILNEYLKKTSSPDLVLENFVRVIRGTSFPSIWYSEFTHKKFFENFLYLCNYSQKTIDLLSNSSLLGDYFLSRKVFIKDIRQDFNELSFSHILLTLTTQFTLGLIDCWKVSSVLSDYVSHVISGILQKQNLHYKYFIAGLGSFGSSNMNFSSDIDLIVVAENVEVDENIQNHFMEFLNLLQKKLKPLEVDFRLRPEGKKSPLVWDLNNYAIYLNSRARVWEFQALTKLKFVCGNEILFKDFQKVTLNLTNSLEENNIKEEIKKMHSSFLKQNSSISVNAINVKKQRGGLTSVDFLIQYFLLSNSKLLKNLQGASYLKLFTALKKVLSVEDINIICENFTKLKNIHLTVQNLFNSSAGVIPETVDKKTLLSHHLNYSNQQDFDKEIKTILRINASLFDKYFGV